MRKQLFIGVIFIFSVFASCNNGHNHTAEQEDKAETIYTCPMHPEIIRKEAGKCPICEMNLVKKVTGGESIRSIGLTSLLRPSNEFVISSIPVTVMRKREEKLEIAALGNIAYDTRQAGTISSRINGRIEKLYVRYRYQKISKGQKIMDIYSPELLTAQQNLLFLLKNDPANSALINASKERLLLLGMEEGQLQQVIRTGKPVFAVSVFSNYTGHIHEAAAGPGMNLPGSAMKDIALLTEELSLKEGMYLQKGQPVFLVYNPARAWAVLNIYADHQALIRTGNLVIISPETNREKRFSGQINFIEPFYRKDSKTVTARVYFDNSRLHIPIGSQVNATISGNTKNAYWLPKEAVLSLGMGNIVFIKEQDGFRAHSVGTGILHENHIQVLAGLTVQDSVASNAQYLVDSESFIKVND